MSKLNRPVGQILMRTAATLILLTVLDAGTLYDSDPPLHSDEVDSEELSSSADIHPEIPPPLRVTLEQLYGAYVESKQDVQRLSDKVDALSAQNSALTDQLISFFTAADAANDSSSEVPSAEELLASSPHQVNTLQIQATGGVTYTRWGRTTCEHDACSLYKGYAAAPHYHDQGGGSDLLCLHEAPQWHRTIPGIANMANLFAVEYYRVGGMFDTHNNYYLPLDGNDVPCVVCHVQTRSAQIMIPARTDCPAGWRREYWGYLLAPSRHDRRTTHACVDQAPESVQGGAREGNVQGLHPVEARTGALRSPPFVDGAELTCVVCSK